MDITRRSFVKTVAAAGAVLPLNGLAKLPIPGRNNSMPAHYKICAFSKLFQFLDYDQMVEVFAAAGLDGIDLTVRPDGHVEPASVKTDLPKAVAAARKQGLSVLMMTTAITDAEDAANVEVLKTAADLGVKYYRFGYLNYDYSLPIPENLDIARKILGKLAKLNEQIGIHGAYQNHSGQPRIGSPVWDLWYILKDMDPAWISCQYDIWHAVIEGYSSWSNGLRLLRSYIKTRCIKDFKWFEHQGKLVPDAVPLGEGLIDFDAYFTLLKKLDLKTDTTLHIQYPVLAEEEQNLPVRKKMDKALAILKRDTDKLKSMMTKNGYV